MKPITPDTTVDAIRAMYPSPMSAKSAEANTTEEGRYCVGGAFMQFYGATEKQGRFPPSFVLGPYLQKANPALDEMRADEFARTITFANDTDRFDVAWERLRAALTWRPHATD